MNSFAERLNAVRERMEAAMAHRGPGPAVTLVGVSKRHPPAAILEALDAGLYDLGENYAQELRDKRRAIDDPRARWHFIGPLQTNKVKYVVGGTALVHTVDRPELLEALERRAAGHDVDVDVLVQVNVAHEGVKSGVDPDALPDLLDRFADVQRVRCRGLMVIPPIGPPEATRPHFVALRQLRDAMASRARPGVELSQLSMGMSADFEVAIEEGASIVRVGTALFGTRPSAD